MRTLTGEPASRAQPKLMRSIFIQTITPALTGSCKTLNISHEVLTTTIEKEWLPMHVGDGAYDAYGNARSFYYRAAVLNRMLHAPERFDFWLHAEWVNKYCDGAKDRETRRVVEQWRKPNSDRRKK
jgi:hypothetical protein